MMNNNKILTVSYGTFSCTLEGFDDSFDTMKEIAEYFRDLAADDRYFGAEPPQPDAEMLARIAERGVARRVEAREHEGRIMLKAHDDAVTPAPLDPAPRGIRASEVERPAAQDPGRDESHAANPVREPVKERPDDLDAAAAFFAERPSHKTGDGAGQADRSAEALAASTPSAGNDPDAAEDFATEDVESGVSFFGEESLAERLHRIRAVVSRQEDACLDTDYYEDTEVAAEFHAFEKSAAFIGNGFATDTDGQDARTVAGAEGRVDVAETQTGDDDDLDRILMRLEDGGTARKEESSDDLAPEFEEGEPAENLFSTCGKVETAKETDSDRLSVRTAEVDRTAAEAVLGSGELELYEDEALARAPVLTDEQEAALQRDLEALEESNAATQTYREATPEIEDTPHSAAASARPGMPDIDAPTGEDVSRLMAEADHQMQEPEGRNRRSAFAHLRAAVAARFADRSMDEADKDSDEVAQAYRSDLAEVVQPLLETPSEWAGQSDGARLAPLKLVAEQRIDTPRTASRGPVAPRRVAASADEDLGMSGDTGFAVYADERGASSLPELLEAAAAYLSYVEGYEQFSRPQLMSRVRQADCGEFTREDGLRSFGQLLRTGKIEKIKGGRFTASEAIGYKPDHRTAG